MLPGPARIFRCPYCNGEKELMSLISGNTFGMDLWSDTRRFYPMFPELSSIQQCPCCHKYYFLEDAKLLERQETSFGGVTGQLDFSQLKEAKDQFSKSALHEDRIWTIHYMLLLAYNDTFFRFPEAERLPSEEDRLLVRETIRTLIGIVQDSPDQTLFHAELLRESGRFEEALQVLDNYSAKDDEIDIVNAMKKHIADKDSKPFLLVEDGVNVI